MCVPVLLAAIPSLLASGATAVGATTAAASLTAGATAAASMTAVQALSLGASLLSTGIGATSAYQGAQTQKAVAANNAKVADVKAQDALRRGDEDAMRVQREGDALKSRQRSVMAARGLDLGEGTAAELQDQTDFFTGQDVATTRGNAKREAWAHRAQSSNFNAEATGINPYRSAAGSLLTSAGSVADKWYAYTGR